MLHIFKRLLLPLALVAVTQTSIVSAESIRLKGPNGEIQSSPQFAQPLTRRSGLANEPSRFYGPTGEQETLWSIASQLRPSNQVSVQQTLYAIYQINPQAFDNQNIHELIPGSNLRIPSLAQIQSATTEQAVNVMTAHQARLTPTQPVAPAPQPQPATPAVTAPVDAPVVESTTPDMMDKPAQDVPSTPESRPQDSASQNSDLKEMANQERQGEVSTLENQLKTSETELMALEEKNHKLRLMLAQVQSEVDVLKDSLGDESRIRNEVEKLLEAERLKLAEEQKMAPSQWDKLLSNTWAVAAMAVVPGLIIGLLVMLLLGRRSKSEPQAETTPEATPTVAPVVPDTLNEDIGDDLLLDDDLFGESDDGEALFSDESEEQSDEADVFADLDDSDLDFNLEGEEGEDPFAGIGDDGDLDETLADEVDSANGISVKGDDKALSLEEMERALDDVVMDDDEDDSFDLSDGGDFSQDDIDSLLAGDSDDDPLESSELDQSMLDDLFAQNKESDDGDVDFDELLDEAENAFDLSDEADDELTQTSIASDDDIDALFAEAEAQANLEDLESNSVDDAALLDEMLESDFQLDDDEEDDFDDLIGADIEESVEPESTELLDELLEADEEDPFEDSQSLLDSELDELIGADELNAPLDAGTDLLDELVGQDGEEDLNDDATDLFEELLDIEQSSEESLEATADDVSPSESVSEDVDTLLDQAQAEEQALPEPEPEPEKGFSSEEFIDDMMSVAPQGDPLLDAQEQDPDLSTLALDEQDESDLIPAEPEPEPVKAAAPDISWGNITLKRAMEQYQASEGAIEAHDALLAVIGECYKQRKNSKYLQLGQEYDTAYSALFAASREKVLSKSPKAEFKGTGFMQLSTLCSDAGRFDAAIALCNKAIEYGLEDGTVTGFEGRIKRIEKARDKASA
ncbi:MAG: hypothetical protein SwBeaBPW_13550 [Shewanella algae]